MPSKQMAGELIFSSSPILTIALALFVCSAGVFVLWHAWSEKKAILAGVGAGLALLAIPIWTIAVGIEFAVVYNLISIALLAWLCCLWQLETKPKRLTNVTASPKKMGNNSKNKWWLLLLSLLLVAGISSALLSVVFCRLLPMDSGNQMAAATLVFPLSWALICLWLCYSRYLLRNNGILVLLSCLSLLVILG